MAAGAETVKGKAWGPLLGPAEHTGASLRKHPGSKCPGPNLTELNSVTFGVGTRERAIVAIALTDSTLFPRFLQPRKLEE